MLGEPWQASVTSRRVIVKIIGIEGLDGQQFACELEQGAKFVVYEYCLSCVILTFKRPSNIYFVLAGESAVVKGLGFSLISVLFGWWGIPWGPIYTIESIITNFSGGRNVTHEVVAALQQVHE